MLVMKDLPFTMPVQIRTDPKAKAAFDRVVADLRASEWVRWKGRRVTKEAVFSAVWLYLDSLDDDELARIFGEWLPRLEALMSGQEPKPGLSGGVNLLPPEKPGQKKKSG